MQNISQPILWVVASIMGLILFAGIYFLIQNINQKKAKKLQELATQKGWKLELSPSREIAYRFRGKTSRGYLWTLQARQRVSRNTLGQSGGTLQTHWWTEAIKAPHQMVLIFPRMKNMDTHSSLGGTLMQFILRRILGEEAEKLSRAKQVQMGGSEFNQAYLMLTTDESLAKSLLTPAAEDVLVRWAKDPRLKIKPGIILGDESLKVSLNQVANPLQLDTLISLGEVLSTSF